MPITTADSRPSVLDTPGGPIHYWTHFDDGYAEQNERDGNLTRMMVSVAWEDSIEFKKYALGFTTATPGATYFERKVPLRVPWAEDQWLVGLKKSKITAGVDGSLKMIPHAPNEIDDNWWEVENGAVVYEAIFANPDYDIIDQDKFRGEFAGDETKRYVVPEEQTCARERKHSSAGYELDLRDAGGVGIADTPIVSEVGFQPFHTVEKTYTQVEVPWDWRPRSAMANCLLTVNTDPVFDNPPGTMLYKGPANKLKWHRQPDESRAVDIPHLFDYNPRGWNTIPRNDGSNQPVRVRGTHAGPKPLYKSSDHRPLFRPQPLAAVEASVIPGTYARPKNTAGAVIAGSGVPVQFNAVVTGLPAPYTFAWDFGDGGTDTTQFPTHAFRTAGTYTVTLTVTDGNGNDSSTTLGSGSTVGMNCIVV